MFRGKTLDRPLFQHVCLALNTIRSLTHEFVLSVNFLTALELGVGSWQASQVAPCMNTWPWAQGPGPPQHPPPPCPSESSGVLRAGAAFPSQASPTSLPTGPAHPVPGTAPFAGSRLSPLHPPGTRRQIPVGPRSAKSALRDGKLQQCGPLGPPLGRLPVTPAPGHLPRS